MFVRQGLGTLITAIIWQCFRQDHHFAMVFTGTPHFAHVDTHNFHTGMSSYIIVNNDQRRLYI